MYRVMVELTFSKVVVSVTLKRQPGKEINHSSLRKTRTILKLVTPIAFPNSCAIVSCLSEVTGTFEEYVTARLDFHL